VMQRIRESLWLSKVKFVEEEKKNAKGFVIGAKFTVPAAVLTDIVIKADHEQGRLHFQATHLFGLGWNTSPFRRRKSATTCSKTSPRR